MLTKNDISQIRTVIKEELDTKLKDYPTKKDLDTKLKHYPTKTDMDKGFEKLNTKLEKSFDYLDRRFLKQDDRISKLEIMHNLPVQSSL